MAGEYADEAAWLYATLSGDSQLAALVGNRIFPDLAPAGTVEPFVIYAETAGTDTNSLGLEISTTRLSYFVRAVNSGGSRAALGPITRRIQALLQGAKAELADASLTVYRSGTRRYPEFKNNVRYNHAGGVYTFVIQPTNEDDTEE